MQIYAEGCKLTQKKDMLHLESVRLSNVPVRVPELTHPPPPTFFPSINDERRPNLQKDFTHHYRPLQ